MAQDQQLDFPYKAQITTLTKCIDIDSCVGLGSGLDLDLDSCIDLKNTSLDLENAGE
jgi:hypothetical protein